MLPPPNEGDLFLDLEGDPYAFDDGIDYLFGVLDTAGTFTPLWSFDPDRPGEVITGGREGRPSRRSSTCSSTGSTRHPGMHVYHYASYEPTALKRLMGRHATREDEVDRLLRGGVWSTSSGRCARASAHRSRATASSASSRCTTSCARSTCGRRRASIVAFEEWLELGEGDRPNSRILDEIAGYNRDDVASTLRLRDWLETLRVELASGRARRFRGRRRSRRGPEDSPRPTRASPRWRRR